MADDDDDTGDRERGPAPSVSRLDRPGDRRYRVLNRAIPRYRQRDRFRRLRTQIPIAELLGSLIDARGLTDEVRQRAVCIYWTEIVGDRVASKTLPVGLVKGVLQVSATSSTWVHELRFLKAQMIDQVNTWIDTHRTWLGPPPLVSDMRFALAMKRRDQLVEPDHVDRLRRRHAWRVRPRAQATPPTASPADLEAIRAETRAIVDPELRALVEGVRTKWNR